MSSLGRDLRWLWAGNAAGNLADGVAVVGLVTGAAIAGPIASAAGLATPFGFAGLILGGCTAYSAGC